MGQTGGLHPFRVSHKIKRARNADPPAMRDGTVHTAPGCCPFLDLRISDPHGPIDDGLNDVLPTIMIAGSTGHLWRSTRTYAVDVGFALLTNAGDQDAMWPSGNPPPWPGRSARPGTRRWRSSPAISTGDERHRRTRRRTVQAATTAARRALACS
jgi:hypothetical protein